jgi:hypothetical protein
MESQVQADKISMSQPTLNRGSFELQDTPKEAVQKVESFGAPPSNSVEKSCSFKQSQAEEEPKKSEKKTGSDGINNQFFNSVRSSEFLKQSINLQDLPNEIERFQKVLDNLKSMYKKQTQIEKLILRQDGGRSGGGSLGRSVRSPKVSANPPSNYRMSSRGGRSSNSPNRLPQTPNEVRSI